MHSLSFGEIAIIVGILFFLFGARRLPAIGSSLGEGIANFKKALSGSDKEEKPKTAQNQGEPAAIPVVNINHTYAQNQQIPPTSFQATNHHNIVDVEQK